MTTPSIPWPAPGRTPHRAGPALDLAGLDLVQLKADRDRICARLASRNPPITAVIPVPRVIPLGGLPRVVHEFRIHDLASLQVWLEEQVPHPLEGIPPSWADPDPSTRLARLGRAWQAAKSWPIRYGSAEGSSLLATPAGRAYFLTLALRDERIGLAETLILLPKVTPQEWAMLRRIAYALSPQEEIAEELAPDNAPASSANWALSAYHAARQEGGPSYLELGDWTLSQWRLFCQEGRPSEYSARFAEQARRVRKILETATDVR